ncbi:MAG: hypothetical protein Q8O53_03845 [Candidatus Moranbacteria bacterium]|nr:hypothetical protein [Candidatus Moranbacteria bacterium]
MEPGENMGSSSEAGGVSPVAPVTPTPEAPKTIFSDTDIAENKFVAALAYLGILFLVPLLAKKESAFAQFHAKQGLVLCIAFVIFSFIPVFGWLINVVLVIVDIIALIKTLSGEAWEIPLIKDAVKKLNI